MIRVTTCVLFLLAVLCSLNTGCSQQVSKEVKFNPIPEGPQPTVSGAGGGAPKAGGGGDAGKKTPTKAVVD